MTNHPNATHLEPSSFECRLHFLRSEWLLPGILFVIFLVLRLPFVSEYPVNWDSVQYMLGIESFDLARHQPHPPGYIGYVALGYVFASLFGDAHRGLVMLSVVSGAFATAAMYTLSRCWLDRRFAFIAALVFGASPIVWYYSVVALNYILEVALVIPIAGLLYRARRDRRWSDLLAATLILSLLGAVRQSGMVLMVPLWMYAAWAFPWRERIVSTIGLVSSMLVWLIPLLLLSGGASTYWRESRALGNLVSEQSTLFESIQVRVAHLAFVTIALSVALMAAIPLFLVFRKHAAIVVRLLPTHDRRFFLIWVIPALATFVLGHMGQPGYVLPIVPVAVIWFAAILARLPNNMPSVKFLVPSMLTAMVVLANSLSFASAPSTVLAVAGGLSGGAPSLSVRALRQYDIRTNDAYWNELISTVRMLSPESVAVIATIGGPRIHGGYRHFSYYLPEYEVYGVGYDRRGFFGHIFTTHDGESNYSVFRLASANPILVLPQNVRYIVTADPEIIDRLPEGLRTFRFDSGKLVVIPRPIGKHLAFLPGDRLVTCYCADVFPEVVVRVTDPPPW